ncbi:hypothetical protein CR513_00310, partial [Mucuna pruriens]
MNKVDNKNENIVPTKKQRAHDASMRMIGSALVKHYMLLICYIWTCGDLSRKSTRLKNKPSTYNYTWTIVDLPPHVTPIGTYGYSKLRGKLMGYTHTERLDFFNTFSLVAKLTTVTMLLALATIND